MATPAQIHANRGNAMKSTGPRSEEGKAASRFNALKHGIEAQSLTIPGEDPAELEALALDYHRHFRPVGPLETFFVETIVKSDWGRRRYARIEAQILRAMVTPGPDGAPGRNPPTDAPLGDAFLNDALKANALQKIFRRQSAAERSYFRALTELRRAQRERVAEEAQENAPPAGNLDSLEKLLESTLIGFVPQDFWRKTPVSAPAAFSGVRPIPPSRPVDCKPGYTEK